METRFLHLIFAKTQHREVFLGTGHTIQYALKRQKFVALGDVVSSGCHAVIWTPAKAQGVQKDQREDKRRTQGWPARPENNSNKRRRTRGEQEGRKREDTELAGAARGHSIQKKDKTRTLSGRRVQGTASQCGQLFSSQEIFLRGNPTSKVFGENKTTRNYSLLGQLDSPSFFKAGMCSQAYPIARAQRVHVRRPLSSYTFTELELPQEVMPDAVTVSLELWLQGQAAKRGE